MPIDILTWEATPDSLERLTEFNDESSTQDFKQMVKSTQELPIDHQVVYDRSGKTINGYSSKFEKDGIAVLFFKHEGRKSKELQCLEELVKAKTIYIPKEAHSLSAALANKYRTPKDNNKKKSKIPVSGVEEIVDKGLPDVVKKFYDFKGNLLEKELFKNTLLEKFRTYRYIFQQDFLYRVNEISQFILLPAAGFVQGAIIPNLIDYLGDPMYEAAGKAAAVLIGVKPLATAWASPRAAEKIDLIKKQKYVLTHFKKAAKKITSLYIPTAVALIALQAPILNTLPENFKVPVAITGLAAFLALDTWAFIETIQQKFGITRYVLSRTPKFDEHSEKYVQTNALSTSISLSLYLAAYGAGYLCRHIPPTALLAATAVVGIPFALSKSGIVAKKPKYSLEIDKKSEFILERVDEHGPDERIAYSFDNITVDPFEETRLYVTPIIKGDQEKYLVWINGKTGIRLKKGGGIKLNPYTPSKYRHIPFTENGSQIIGFDGNEIILRCYRKTQPTIEHDGNTITLS